jgi:hypothetical protein
VVKIIKPKCQADSKRYIDFGSKLFWCLIKLNFILYFGNWKKILGNTKNRRKTLVLKYLLTHNTKVCIILYIYVAELGYDIIEGTE